MKNIKKIIFVLMALLLMTACSFNKNNTEKDIEISDLDDKDHIWDIYVASLDESKFSRVITDKESDIIEYSVAMSSLVGIPMEVVINQDCDELYDLFGKTEKGLLLFWDRETGAIEEIEEHEIEREEIFFYQPPPEKFDTNEIKFTLKYKGEIVEEKIIVVKNVNFSEFTVKLKNSDT
ncbi:MAG: hypothetical protein Q4P29_07155 [Tissierellia bacterium]|nr:hypothetical protein [Tissierellia bacterium]